MLTIKVYITMWQLTLELDFPYLDPKAGSIFAEMAYHRGIFEIVDY